MKRGEQPGSPWEHVFEENASPQMSVKIEDMDSFKKFGVLYEKRQGLPGIRVFPWDCPSHSHSVTLPSWAACSVIQPGVNSHHESSKVRFALSSPVIPPINFDYDMESHILHTAHAKTAMGNGGQHFCCSQVNATSDDGTSVPLTLAHREDLELNGNNPTLLFGYGAYGINLELNFKPEWIPLLERGWVLGYAHVRGGGELGKQWHAEGREMKKVKSFEDFIACAEYLVDNKYTNPSRLAGHGSSAGGLIIGYIANNRPDLFKALVMRVPFLDVANTMQNPSLPLTVHEYDEWGDPECTEVLKYLQSYSPYSNVSSQEYPWMFISTALNDARVQMSECLKWKASICNLNMANDRKICIYANSDSGHMGAPNESDYFADTALEISFLYQSLNLFDKDAPKT